MSVVEKGTPECVTVLKIDREPIELYKVLKIENLVNGGGEAKYVIAEGFVRLNGVVETRKGKKVFSGDMVEYRGEQIRIVVSGEASSGA